jgi:hypothetical protein
MNRFCLPICNNHLQKLFGIDAIFYVLGKAPLDSLSGSPPVAKPKGRLIAAADDVVRGFDQKKGDACVILSSSGCG